MFICQQKIFKPLSKFPHRHFATGLTVEGSNVLNVKSGANDFTTPINLKVYSESNPHNQLFNQNMVLSTPGSQVSLKNKQEICNDKLTVSERPVRLTNLSKMLDQVSISKEKGLSPFWTSSTATWSQKLWSCTRIDCVDLESTWWNTSSKNLALNSWFSATMKIPREHPPQSLQKILSPLQLSLLQNIMDKDQQITVNAAEPPKKKRKTTQKPDERPLKTIQLRIFPTVKQRKIMWQWMGTVRWTYNQCVVAFKNSIPATKGELRPKIVNNCNYDKENVWVKDTPYDMRDFAMDDFIQGVKRNFEKRKLQPDHTFHMRFKSRKDPQQSFRLRARQWGNVKSKGILGKLFNPSLRVEKSKAVPSGGLCKEWIEHDMRVICTRERKWFISIPIPIVNHGENQTINKGVIALDPGVRTFMTGYDACGGLTEWGKQDASRLMRLEAIFSKLWARSMQKYRRNRSKRSHKRAALRIKKRIRNLVDEMHKKLATWLCQNYSTVLIPNFGVQKMVLKQNRNIGKKTSKAMLTWAHYRFRQRLIHKSREYGCKIIVCSEAYTSKTCGLCGALHPSLGGRKVFCCPHCKFTIDRDANGARNILLRYLS